jgi:hypothetical protein
MENRRSTVADEICGPHRVLRMSSEVLKLSVCILEANLTSAKVLPRHLDESDIHRNRTVCCQCQRPNQLTILACRLINPSITSSDRVELWRRHERALAEGGLDPVRRTGFLS